MTISQTPGRTGERVWTSGDWTDYYHRCDAFDCGVACQAYSACSFRHLGYQCGCPRIEVNIEAVKLKKGGKS